MLPDTVSSLFPDRPIRPLPTRKLREKLSPEIADSIKYPPFTHDATPLFYYPSYTSKDLGSPTSDKSFDSLKVEAGRDYTRRNGRMPGDRALDDPALRNALASKTSPESHPRLSGNHAAAGRQGRTDHHPPLSAASSLDGYDSFENTNNKKKRKIPSNSDPVLNGTQGLHNDMNSLALEPVSRNIEGRPSGYSGSAAGSQGVSGSGRGRLGVSRNGRSPLRTLADGSNTWAPRLIPKSGSHQYPGSDRQSGGIISNAIANAEKLPLQGQENVSLLQQRALPEKTTPASSQFTFTCDSQVPGTIKWPEHPNKHNMATQTTSAAYPAPATAPRAPTEASPQTSGGGPRGSRRKGRQSLDRELSRAARHRRELATDSYYHNPPRPEDIWICEFCEYEQIFRTPPRALIQKYELKDRRQRQEEADRKRLLEKAKAKSRKSRKNAKSQAKTQTSAANEAAPGHVDPLNENGGPPMQQGQSRSTQSEDDYDEYDDDDTGTSGAAIQKAEPEQVTVAKDEGKDGDESVADGNGQAGETDRRGDPR